MTDQHHEQLRFYEEEWLKASAQYTTEKQQRLVLDAQIQQLREENNDLRVQADAITQARNANQELIDLRAQLEQARVQLAGLDRVAELECKLMVERKLLATVQRRWARPDFWRGLASEFAESLETFPAINGSPEADPDQLAQQAVRDWHAEIELTLEGALSGAGDTERLERARKILIAQWVLLRWLEVSEVAR